jgi:hypothetical protein
MKAGVLFYPTVYYPISWSMIHSNVYICCSSRGTMSTAAADLLNSQGVNLEAADVRAHFHL